MINLDRQCPSFEKIRLVIMSLLTTFDKDLVQKNVVLDGLPLSKFSKGNNPKRSDHEKTKI